MIDEHRLEGYYETGDGLVFVQSKVVMSGDHILFDGLSFYPVSSAKMVLNVGDGVRIFHTIMDEARGLDSDLAPFRRSGLVGQSQGVC